MRRYRCAVIDHFATPQLLQQVVSLLECRPDVDCDVLPVNSALGARGELVVVCSGAPGRQSLLSLVAGCRSRHALRALLVVGELDCERDLRGLITLGVTDFLRVPLFGAEFNARLDRVLGLGYCGQADPVAEWLGCNELALRSENPRFNAQLARLPRLAGAGVDVLVSGARGTGRRALARVLARMAGDTAPCVVDADRADAWLAAQAPLSDPGDAGAADSRCVLVHDLQQWPATAQQALCEWLRERNAAGLRFRLIATAAADARQLQARGTLIAPLAELLDAHHVRVPSLRERPEDVIVLARALIGVFCARERRPPPGLTPSAVARLMSHAWPDNFYGLRRTLERSLRVAGTMIAAHDLLFDDADAPEACEQSLREVKARLVVSFERTFLEQLLESCRGNINMAARLSKKNRRALFELIRKHNIDVVRFRRTDNDPPLRVEEPMSVYQTGAS